MSRHVEVATEPHPGQSPYKLFGYCTQCGKSLIDLEMVRCSTGQSYHRMFCFCGFADNALFIIEKKALKAIDPLGKAFIEETEMLIKNFTKEKLIVEEKMRQEAKQRTKTIIEQMKEEEVKFTIGTLKEEIKEAEVTQEVATSMLRELARQKNEGTFDAKIRKNEGFAHIGQIQPEDGSKGINLVIPK